MPYPLFRKVLPITWLYAVIIGLVFIAPSWWVNSSGFEVVIGETQVVIQGWVQKLLGSLLVFVNAYLLYAAFNHTGGLKTESISPFVALIFVNACLLNWQGLSLGLMAQTALSMLVYQAMRLYDQEDNRLILFNAGIWCFILAMLLPLGFLFITFLIVATLINKTVSFKNGFIGVLGFALPFLLWKLGQWVFNWNFDWHWLSTKDNLSAFEFFFFTLKGQVLMLGSLVIIIIGVVTALKSIRERAIAGKTKVRTALVFAAFTFSILGTMLGFEDRGDVVLLLPLIVAVPLTFALANIQKRWLLDVLVVISLSIWVMNFYLSL